MPKYQMIFDTQAGEINYTVDIDYNESLDDVLREILAELEENGYILRGWREGAGDVVCKWEGRELKLKTPLPQQRVNPNDILRVEIGKPSLQVRRDNETFDVNQRVELCEGDDIFIGRTILGFHISSQQKATNKNHTFIQRVQQERSFQQTVYFLSLIGGIAGLLCWFFGSLIKIASDGQFNLEISNDAINDAINYTLLGGFIGGLSVGFNDHWLGGRVVARWVLMGIVTGGIGGLLGGLIAGQIKPHLSHLLFCVIAWLIAGAIIGFSISLRWVKTNKNRVIHGLLGGLVGGALGGLAYGTIGGESTSAIAYILTGIGITCGISLAPILFRQGVIQFRNSRDPVVIKKYAQSQKKWELHEGGKYLIGSQSGSETRTVFTPEVQIFIPDQLIAPKHAILFVRERHYFLEPHPELTLSTDRNQRKKQAREYRV